MGVLGAIRSVSSSTFTFGLTDNVVECDTTSNAITGTLPTAASSTGKNYVISIIAGANSATISAHAGELIAGTLSWTVNSIGSALSVISDGTGWAFT